MQKSVINAIVRSTTTTIYELKEDASATCLVRNKTSLLSPHSGRAVLNYNFLQVPRKKLMHNIMQYSGGATTTTTD